ncbi:hypothetical protein AVO45_09455 [Ruegeria marisrubri]|uniref:O-antigen ligase-related domain-containing protein n=1 Tax=Ruegeria marisrubri TaxID=1685379 RepID=A0A0X3TR02_9RHOB|nr:O-antigen ligase family protein [Ruegeria marisrubri]KUJ78164.1 hypothetical protein AVO45_09455 [Ruegeria marisrubri]
MIMTGQRKELATIVGVGLIVFWVALVIGDSSPVKLAALVVFWGVCVLTLLKPLIGLSILVVMIVSNLSNNLIEIGFPGPSVAKLAAPGLIALLGARYLLWGDRPYVGWLALWLMVGFLALKLFGATYAVDWRVTLDVASGFGKDAIIAMLALAFMNYRNGVKTVVLSAVLTAAVICALGLVQVIGYSLPSNLEIFAHFGRFHGRFEGPIDDANFFAVVLVFCIPAALFQLLQTRNPLKLIFWSIALALLLFGFLATQSRGGIVALSVAFGILFLRLNASQKLAAIVALAGLAVVAATLLGPEVFDRLSTIVDLVQEQRVDLSTEGRLVSWAVAVEIFFSNPWLGVGGGNFNILFQDLALEMGLMFRGEGRSTHSLYLEVLAEQGILGLLYFLFIIWCAAVGLLGAYQQAKTHRNKRLENLYLALGAGLAGYLTGMALLHDAYPRFLWILIALAIEAGRIAQLNFERQNTETPHRSENASAEA